MIERKAFELMRKDCQLKKEANLLFERTCQYKYSYHFKWLSRPIIQYPQDIVAMQELIWAVRPDLIIETGIAHGGSLVFSASMLALLDMSDAIVSKTFFDPVVPHRVVIGVDIDMRSHNRAALEAHPMYSRIRIIEGSSIDSDVIGRVYDMAAGFQTILVCLDSMHSHSHVLAELEAYAPLVSPGSYCVVFDTVIEDLPAGFFPDRPWGPGNNPKTAVDEYMKLIKQEGRRARDGDRLCFVVDKDIEEKLLLTVAPGGYLCRRPSSGQ
jgi:cephalosporin hydroxylase